MLTSAKYVLVLFPPFINSTNGILRKIFQARQAAPIISRCSRLSFLSRWYFPLRPDQQRGALKKKPKIKESRWNIIIIYSGDIYSHFLHVPARDTAKPWQPSGNYKKRNCVPRTSVRFVKFSWQFHGPELYGYCRSDPEWLVWHWYWNHWKSEKGWTIFTPYI